MTYDQYGSNEVLDLAEIDQPKVGPGEVRIRVTRAAVNPVDWKLMAGGLDVLMDSHFPVIPGWDVAGVVDAVGPDVPEFSAGDRVAAYARKQINQAGTFAEYVTVWADHVAHVPDSVSDDVAAALPLTGLTALRTLETLEVGTGDRLLIHAASGGVGYLATQMALARGAEVVGTASRANHEKLRELGAVPVAYGDELQATLTQLNPDGFDAVADFAGETLSVSQVVVRDGAALASIADPAYVQAGGSWVWVRPDGARLELLLSMVEDGALDVAIDRTFELDEVAQAFAYNQQGSGTGKILIRVAD
ncbi:NADP-dependent oxidoreductase [Kocuria sp.]|uniref:NADP-dependent oxidoreductase n=1 Tax=Kocuria sp. TaxID=1871328 RepID=UPI0026DECDCA|nr:NADP-dependent oxidoreductase [Kocuria sp.]MDO5617223.1 NADP-dependent oxidoreductase [Kocuria sp.]